MFALLALPILIGAAQTSATETPEKPDPLQCDRGPTSRTFGEVPWLVYACDDGATLVVVTGPTPTRQLSFVFILSPKNGSYALHGEGNGDQNLTRPAYEALSAMTPDALRALYAEAVATGQSAAAVD